MEWFWFIIASLGAGLLVLKLTEGLPWPRALLLPGVGALIGAAAELFSPSEYDTVTVPAAITAALLLVSGLV